MTKGKAENTTVPPATPASLKRQIATLKASETRLKQTIASLRKSESYFRAITQNASDLIIVADRQARFLYVNTALERILGYRPEELIGRSCLQFIATRDLPRAIADYTKAIRTTERLVENGFHVRHKNGSERYLEGVGLNLLDDPVVAGFVMNVRDVTERKQTEAELDCYRKELEKRVQERTVELATANARLQVELAERQRAEEALRTSETLYRALVQQSTDIISITDAEGRFLFNSPAVEKILGYPPDKLLNRSVFDYIHPEDRQRIRDRFAGVVDGPRSGLMTALRMRKNDGTWCYLECRGNNLLNDPGIRGIVITSRDVTKMRLAEAEQRRLEGRLSQARKMESLGTLAGRVAHDLNNVLGVLVGYAELLIQEAPEGHPSHQRVTRILQSSLKAAAIIEDLLTMARRGVRVSDVVSLNEIISTYLKTPEFEKIKAYHPQVQVKTFLSAGLLNVKGSPVHLEKMIMNLISNAAEAISGEGEVQIRTQNVYLSKPLPGCGTVQEGGYCLVTVTDNGRGISPEERERIFEPFYTKKVMGRSGTGLGLAVVWGTVQDHEGYIDVESAAGQGSTFSIYLPATREALKERRPDLPPATYIGRGESILVIDDVAEQREVAMTMLTTLGYQVETAASGEEALACLQVRPRDLLLLDMVMDPGMDGLETYRRALEINPGQRAVIISGYSETRRLRETRRLGAGAYVKKPFTLEKIGLAIRKTLDQ